MATVERPPRILDEVADFIASGPSREQLLAFRPSEAIQRRAGELVAKLKAGRLTDEEQHELDQFGHAETLIRLIKARLHAPGACHE